MVVQPDAGTEGRPGCAFVTCTLVNDDQFLATVCECDNSAPQQGPCAPALECYGRLAGGERLPRGETPGCLWELRLVVEDPRLPGSVMAVPPEAAAFSVLAPLEESIAEQQLSLRSARSVLAAFGEVYSEVRRQEQPPLTLLTGAPLINRMLEAAVDGCRAELLTAHPGGGRPAGVLSEAVERDVRLLSRGVRQRTLYQHTVRSHPTTLSYIERVTAAGAEVRTLAEVFERLIICDRETAFIPVAENAAEGESAALQVRHPALVRFLARFFDNAWTRSVPVRTESLRTPTIASDIQRTILLGVVSGETDESIARRLGMSRRSVAEHIRKVSQRLESNSRAQLGYRLATSGLLGPEGDAWPGGTVPAE